MKFLKDFVTLNVFVIIISTSVAGRLLQKRDASDDDYYDDEPASEPAGKSKEDSGECEEEFTSHVECQHKGILIVLTHESNQGKFFVTGHQDENDCMKALSKSGRETSLNIPFGKCGLKKETNVKFNITVLPNEKVLGAGAATIPVDCPYLPHNSTVSDDLPKKELPHNAHAPANAKGPPEPTYTLTITEHNGPKNQKMTHADIKITPHVANARAKDCFAYAKNDTSNSLQLTDSDGCPTNPKIFPGWEWNDNSKKLESKFESFQLVDADTTGINCTVESCYIETDCGPPCPKADTPRRKCKGKP